VVWWEYISTVGMSAGYDRGGGGMEDDEEDTGPPYDMDMEEEEGGTLADLFSYGV